MSTKFINWIILIVLALIWGSSFILMKRGLDVYSSDEVAALRILIAFLFLSPLLFRHVKRPLLVHWKSFVAMGTFGNFIPAFLFTKAETGLSSSLAGILNSLTPLFTLLLGVMFFRAKTRMVNVIGLMLGFIGAVGLMTVGKNVDINSNLLYGSYIILATLFYGLSVNVIKSKLGGVNPITATVWAMMFIGPMAGMYLFGFTDFTTRLSSNPQALQSLGYVSILAIFGTALSVIVFNVLIKNTSALFASSVTYLIPIVAMGWGGVDGDSIYFLHYLWIGLILIGVYLVNKKKSLKILPE